MEQLRFNKYAMARSRKIPMLGTICNDPWTGKIVFYGSPHKIRLQDDMVDSKRQKQKDRDEIRWRQITKRNVQTGFGMSILNRNKSANSWQIII